MTKSTTHKSKLYKGATSLAIMCVCGALVSALPLRHAMAVSLKDSSLIKNDKITLGDVFYDLPKDEDRVLGAAPKPGQEMVLNSRTLLRIALALDLSWRPSSQTDKIVLRRDATVIEQKIIEDALKNRLTEEGVSGDYMLNLTEALQDINLPADQPGTIEVTKLTLNQDGKSFDAIVMAPSASNPIQTLRVTGNIQSVMTVPVLKENLTNGRTIQDSDIEYKQIRDIDFTSDVVADANALIGMTARRMIVAGRPIRTTEIQAERIIERGELVILSLSTGTLNLTTEAKALEHGAKGDVIRVLNTASNQTLQALVIGDNQVAIMQN
jgi:flagellar basal body P-ring formation protein FlgA